MFRIIHSVLLIKKKQNVKHNINTTIFSLGGDLIDDNLESSSKQVSLTTNHDYLFIKKLVKSNEIYDKKGIYTVFIDSINVLTFTNIIDNFILFRSKIINTITINNNGSDTTYRTPVELIDITFNYEYPNNKIISEIIFSIFFPSLEPKTEIFEYFI